MQTLSTLSELYLMRASLTGTVGLVPTMGALHPGHLSLVSRAKRECHWVGVSIFVNPTQFGPGEDFKSYPRNLERDLELLARAEADVVWIPAVELLYPSGHQTWVSVDRVSLPLEGKFRSGHFRGVATIVAKLFNAFRPDKAYFGQKDAQQVVVIKRMVLDLNYPIDIVVCPIVREPDGLAMSSRNANLNAAERKSAAVLYRALDGARRRYDAGERNADQLRASMRSILLEEPLAHEEYVSVADPESLLELETARECALLSLAVKIGKTRLIDNIVF
jgi:pantoate--beta-alanine ligase